MNYLALCSRLRQECRVSGSGPTAITGQTAEYTRLITWASEAWLEIQRANPRWRFLRASCSCTTVQAQSAYTATSFGLTDFGSWALDYSNGDTFRSYDTAAGITSEVPLVPIDYDQWRDTYLFGATRTTYSRPVVIAVAPDDSLVTGPVAAAGYTLIGDYYKKPTELVSATDIPAMPSQFHMAIVYKAMEFYAMSEAAPEVLAMAQIGYARTMRALARHQGERYRLAGALA